ncbi:MAG: phosphoribosyltransferase family protein, partial [Candidatus Micrarchaeia archaeon]
DKLTKEEIDLLKRRGPKENFKNKIYTGIDFFEKAHEDFKKEKGIIKFGEKEISYCNYYIPFNLITNLIVSGVITEPLIVQKEGKDFMLINTNHIPSRIIYNSKIWFDEDEEYKHIIELNALYCAAILAENLPNLNIDLILPVSHRKESFTEKIAYKLFSILSAYIPIEFDNNFIQITRDIQRNSKLSLRQRQSNIEGAFELKKGISNKKILLVDDIITTGITINEYDLLLEPSNEVKMSVVFATRYPNREQPTIELEYMFVPDFN